MRVGSKAEEREGSQAVAQEGRKAEERGAAKAVWRVV